MRNRTWEPRETQIVVEEVKEGDVVLDIGANIGYYTLLFARLVGDQGKVFAFEPDPVNFSLLERNVLINGYRNVTLIRKAVWNETGGLRLYLDDRHKGDHRVYDSHDGRESIVIDAVRLDDYFQDCSSRIDFIKMDIQGAEAMAVDGMRLLLRRNRHVKLLTEFWPVGLKRCGIEPAVFLRMLLSWGFNVYRIEEAPELANVDQAKSHTVGFFDFANLFCSKDAWRNKARWDWERWLQGWGELREWVDQLQLAITEMVAIIPAGHAFILADADNFSYQGTAGRRPIPFLERDGQYWGPPPDDQIAIREFERLRQAGATFFVFGWPTFWWLDYYSGFLHHLRSEFRCVLENDRLVAFDLRPQARLSPIDRAD